MSRSVDDMSHVRLTVDIAWWVKPFLIAMYVPGMIVCLMPSRYFNSFCEWVSTVVAHGFRVGISDAN